MRAAGAVCVAYPPAGPHDAIEQNSRGLAEELRRRGVDACFAPGAARLLARRSIARAGGWQLVAYMPFSYGRWGFAPGLVAAMLLARLLPGAPRPALLVHEAAIETEGPRTLVMGGWQRLQLRALVALAERRFGSTQVVSELLRAMHGGSPVTHLPSPSNVPLAMLDRVAARALVGVAEEEFVIAVFGGRHPSRATGHVEAALRACAGQSARCVLVNLGAEPPAIAAPAGVRVVAPGPLEPDALSAHLRAADLYLAPFHDGTSTRRTTLAAALAHGLPVIGTDGAQTDDLLRSARSGCVLVAVDDVAGFAAAALALAQDPVARAARGRDALAFTDAELSLRVVGDRVMHALGLGDVRGAAQPEGLAQ